MAVEFAPGGAGWQVGRFEGWQVEGWAAIVGQDGSLTGFGGGLEAKLFLLQLEGVQVPEAMQASLF